MAPVWLALLGIVVFRVIGNKQSPEADTVEDKFEVLSIRMLPCRQGM